MTLPLGGAFHAGRLTIRSSQVGLVGSSRRSARTRHERLTIAVDLLRDSAFEVLLAESRPFEELPALLAAMAAGERTGPCQVIEYGGA